MAPFSRLCTAAFCVGGATHIQRHLQRPIEPITPLWKYNEILLRRQGCYELLQYIACLASPSDVSQDSVPSVIEPSIRNVTDLSRLCESLGVMPSNLLHLETSDNGVRGVHVSRGVPKNDVLLSIPLDSCLRDDTPPAWFLKAHGEDDSPTLQPNAWATRLAASLIDTQMSSQCPDGIKLWLQLLPDAKLLRASLPVHWDEELVSSTQCTALELAVDSAYFSRAEAIADLTMALVDNGTNDKNAEELCDNALDVVQTRSCRVEASDGTYIRLLAPIFDFINHASTCNAVFSLEKDDLVVRATRDLSAKEQVFIDYGDSARPHWRCLASYGFVPEYSEQDEDTNVAEVYVHGKRFEVGPSTIPVDLVETVEALSISEGHYEPHHSVDDKSEAILSPSIATRISKRLRQVAFQLVLGPINEEEELATMYEDAVDENDEQEEKYQVPEDLVSARLAASLRYAQHRTLLACARGLMELSEGNVIARMRGEV